MPTYNLDSMICVQIVESPLEWLSVCMWTLSTPSWLLSSKHKLVEPFPVNYISLYFCIRLSPEINKWNWAFVFFFNHPWDRQTAFANFCKGWSFTILKLEYLYPSIKMLRFTRFGKSKIFKIIQNKEILSGFFLLSPRFSKNKFPPLHK